MTFSEIERFIKKDIERMDNGYAALGYSEREAEIAKKSGAYGMIRVLVAAGVLSGDDGIKMFERVSDAIYHVGV